MNKFFNKLKNFFLNLSWFLKKAKTGFTGVRAEADWDKKLVFSLAKSRWPNLKQLKYIRKYLSQAERLTIGSCFLVILLSSLFLSVRFYQTHLRVMPVNGGEYIEGAIGTIKYVNPLYSSVSDLDSDVAGLVFSSLFSRGENAQLVNDLVLSHKISSDGKVYEIKIRTDAKWHNGGILTVNDIIFTFAAIKNPQYKSPWRAGFNGVEIEKVDEQTVKFNLAEPYAAFLDLLTFGILPEEQWQQIEPAAASLAELNLKPIGSGRFKFKSLVKDKAGNIRAYNLVRNADYYREPAHIETFTFKLFGNLTEALSALNNNLIGGLSYLPEQAKQQVVAQDSLNFYRLNLPKLSAIFFNAKADPALADKKVRQALAYAINKDKIIAEVMAGNARAIDSPILPESFAYSASAKKYNYDTASSSRLLAEAGWKVVELKEEDIKKAEADLTAKDEVVKKQAEAKIRMGAGKWLFKNNNYLSFSLTTVDNPEYSQTAVIVASLWRAVNVKVKVNLIPANNIQTDVIRPRNFTALFFGEITGADPDPYQFWHSSQIGQAGLNLADYSNKEADKLLEDGRLTNDFKARQEKYKKFQEIIAEEEPAIFLYSPYYTYVQSKNIKGFSVKNIILPSDRFADANQWYIKTGKKIVW